MASKGVLLKDSDSNNIYPCPYFPVGSIYMSVNSTNPSNYFGGTWTQIKDRFLLACGSTYSNGATGGEAKHTLTVSEMPSHKHTLKVVKDSDSNSGGDLPKANNTTGFNTGWSSGNDDGIQNTGGGSAHNNMPPYLAVYVWKRTA
jgi:trimeric autotransporter adhesin